MSTTLQEEAPQDIALRKSSYEYELPQELIAQRPLPQRDLARLMVVDRRHHRRIHSVVRDLPSHLRAGDLLVVNDTRVIPARVFARTSTGGQAELLFVRPLPNTETSRPVWICLGRPARCLKPGRILEVAAGVTIEVVARQDAGRYLVRWAAGVDVVKFLETHGQVPLPPYIKRRGGVSPVDTERYQTVFATTPGSVAAPTAGLHFTPELFDRLRDTGVSVARLTLHVGPGTFLPIRCEDVREHPMEPEWCRIPEDTARAIRATKAHGGRVIAVGTTTTRALESAATDGPDVVLEGDRWADRYIVPGYRFRVVDALLTNFHLPGSTLLLLVAAMLGRNFLLECYAEAVSLRYRFYSYGDAMLIL